jgi:tRNA G18 (ribose-2'-O)-methylase SpoU
MNERSILLLGNEASGLGAEMQTIADKLVEIERTGPVDSLNVAMAGTILMDRLTRQ